MAILPNEGEQEKERRRRSPQSNDVQIGKAKKKKIKMMKMTKFWVGGKGTGRDSPRKVPAVKGGVWFSYYSWIHGMGTLIGHCNSSLG